MTRPKGAFTVHIICPLLKHFVHLVGLQSFSGGNTFFDSAHLQLKYYHRSRDLFVLISTQQYFKKSSVDGKPSGVRSLLG